MATIRERPRSDGSVGFQVIYQHHGRQRYQAHDTLKSAQKAKNLIERLGPDTAIPLLEQRDRKVDAAPLLGDWCMEHIETLTNATEGTKDRYRKMVERDLGSLAWIPVDMLTADEVRKWVTGMQRAGASSKTIANKQGFLSAALKHAMDNGLVARNVARGIRVAETVRAPMEFLTPDEFAILLGHVAPHARGLVTLLAGTGLRWGEATALQAQDWDAHTRLLRVVRAWKEAASGVELGPPKTRRSLRTIMPPVEVADILDEATRGKKPDEFIFTTPKGKPWHTGGHFHEFVWQPAVAAARGEVYWSPRSKSRAKGYDPTKGKPWLTPAPETRRIYKSPRIHDLRHTAASWMLQNGTLIQNVQAYLGHESIKTTVDRYGHLAPNHMTQSAAALSAGLSAALPQIEG